MLTLVAESRALRIRLPNPVHRGVVEAAESVFEVGEELEVVGLFLNSFCLIGFALLGREC